MLVTTPLYFSWQEVDQPAPRIYLAGVARLATALPPQTLIVHHLPYPPKNFHHFCLLRFQAWEQVPRAFPADAYFVVDADMHPYPSFYSTVRDLLREWDGVLIGYDMVAFVREGGHAVPTCWGWRWIYRHFGIKYRWHVGGGCWGARDGLWQQVVEKARELYYQYWEMGGEAVERYEWAAATGNLSEEHTVSAACEMIPARWLHLPLWHRHHLDLNRTVSYNNIPLLTIYNTHGEWERRKTMELLGDWLQKEPTELWKLIKERQVVLEGVDL